MKRTIRCTTREAAIKLAAHLTQIAPTARTGFDGDRDITTDADDVQVSLATAAMLRESIPPIDENATFLRAQAWLAPRPDGFPVGDALRHAMLDTAADLGVLGKHGHDRDPLLVAKMLHVWGVSREEWANFAAAVLVALVDVASTPHVALMLGEPEAHGKRRSP